MLSDISNISNNNDLIYITTAVIIIDLIVILIAKNTTLFNKQINVWYDKFGMTAVFLDVAIIIIGLIITRYIFSIYKLTFNPLYFILIALAVQLVHDVLLYKLVIVPYPEGNNQIIDVYKKYADENGYKVVVADSAMMLGSALLAMYLKNKEMKKEIIIGSTALIVIGILYFAFKKKNEEQTNLSEDLDFQAVLDKIDKAPK